MKKFLALILALLMIVGVLASCGGNDNTDLPDDDNEQNLEKEENIETDKNGNSINNGTGNNTGSNNENVSPENDKNQTSTCNHNYDQWVVESEATCANNGKKYRICKVCNEKEIQEIYSDGHTFNESNECTVCQYKLESTKGLQYGEITVDNKTVYAVTGMGAAKDTDIVIPAYHTDKKVEAIAEDAFKGNELITSIYIPDSIKYIFDEAFSYCTSLTNAYISKSITTIGNKAFYSCTELNNINIGDSIRYLYKDAFTKTSYYNNAQNWKNNILYLGNCLLSAKTDIKNDVTIKDGVKIIADSAFYDCVDLHHVTLPQSLTTINQKAFYNCSNLENIDFHDDIDYIDDYAFYRCSNITEVIFDVTPFIGEAAFYGTNIKKAKIAMSKLKCLPKSNVESLNVYHVRESYSEIKFSDFTNLKELTVDEVYENIFYNCGKLESLTVPSFKELFGYYFGTTEYNGSKKITQEYKNNNWEETDYYFPKNLKNVTVNLKALFYTKSSVYGLEDYAFSNCSFENLEFNYSGIKNILANQEVIYKATIGKVSLPAKCILNFNSIYPLYKNTSYTIDTLNFKGTVNEWYETPLAQIKSNTVTVNDVPYMPTGDVLIPDGVTKIAAYKFFRNTDITSIKIPDSVTSISDYAFYGCTGLTSITIPDSVTTIGYDVFWGCTKLTSVYITDIAKWCEISFGDTGANPLCYAENLYLNGNLVTNLVIPNSVTSIGDYAFYSCDSLTSVIIPDSVTSISSWAFEHCRSLTSINVDENNSTYKSIDGNLYSKDGKALIQYAIGKTDISFVIPDSVTSIGYEAFYNCDSLTSVTIPDSVTSIGNYAFRFCDSLTSINYRGTEEQWNAISKSDAQIPTSCVITYNYTGE